MIMNINIKCTCGNDTFYLQSESEPADSLSGRTQKVSLLKGIDNEIGEYYSLKFICTKCGFIHEVTMGSD